MTPSRWMQGWIAAACCACGLALAATRASAETVTINFEHIGDSGDPTLPSYTESGFIFTSLAANGHLHYAYQDLWLHSNVGSSPYHITRLDGASFDLLAFDYSGGDSVFVTDTGATFTILGDQPLATFTLPASFQNVKYIDWTMNTPGDPADFYEQWGGIDNIVANVLPVPEPAPVAMLGLGLIGLFLHGRRRR